MVALRCHCYYYCRRYRCTGLRWMRTTTTTMMIVVSADPSGHRGGQVFADCNRNGQTKDRRQRQQEHLHRFRRAAACSVDDFCFHRARCCRHCCCNPERHAENWRSFRSLLTVVAAAYRNDVQTLMKMEVLVCCWNCLIHSAAAVAVARIRTIRNVAVDLSVTCSSSSWREVCVVSIDRLQ